MSELDSTQDCLRPWEDATLEVTVADLSLDLVEKICVVVLFAYITLLVTIVIMIDLFTRGIEIGKLLTGPKF